MPMPNFPAGAQKYQPITMRYSEDWSDADKAGEVVPSSDVTKIYCFVINKKTDAIELTLSSDEGEGITWEDEAAGEILIEFSSVNTQGITAGAKKYEVWAILAVGSKALVDDGEFTLFASKAASAT